MSVVMLLLYGELYHVICLFLLRFVCGCLCLHVLACILVCGCSLYTSWYGTWLNMVSFDEISDSLLLMFSGFC